MEMDVELELGDSPESNFDFDLFDSLLLRHSGLKPLINCGLHCPMYSQNHTVISLGLAVNAQ